MKYFEFFQTCQYIKRVWYSVLSLQVYLPNKIPLYFMWCGTLHLFSDTQRWWIPRGSLRSHSDVPLCVSSSMYIISSSFTTATTSISDGIIFLCVCATYHGFFSYFDRVWGGILFLSAQCGWVLHCFKWRTILCNLRDTAKSDFFKINSRDSCSDLAGMWRHTLFEQITKIQVLVLLILLGCSVFL